MICYKDMTFCNSWDSCTKGDDCPRAITEHVLIDAEEKGLLLSVVDKLECYVEDNCDHCDK